MNGRNILLGSSLTFFVCWALFSAEKKGFRVFDHGFGWHPVSKESVILSPLELLVFFGSLALGAVSGLVVVISLLVWLRYLVTKPANAP